MNQKENKKDIKNIILQPTAMGRLKIMIVVCLLPFSSAIFAQSDLYEAGKNYANKLGIDKNVFKGVEFAGDIFRMHKSNKEYKNTLSEVSRLNIEIKDPDALLREYNDRLEKIKAEAEAQKARKKEEIDAMAKTLADEAANLAAKANISTGNAIADLGIKLLAEKGGGAIAKKAAEKKIKAAEEQAEKDLAEFMKKAMGNIKDDIIKQNEQAREEYLKHAAYCFSESEENRDVENLKFHECIIEQVNKNYSWKNTDWIKTSCIAPPKLLGEFINKPDSKKDYIACARRKYKIYNEKYKHQAFLDATTKFTEAALAENPNDAGAYLFMSQLKDDIFDKYLYANFALYLDQNNAEIVTNYKMVKFKFAYEFFKAISENNTSFIKKTVENKYHLGLKDDKNNSPLEVAIATDKPDLMEMFTENRSKEVLKNNFFIAINKNAMACLKKLIDSGLKLNEVGNNGKGEPPLYAAAASKADAIANFLIENNANSDASLKFAKTKGNSEALSYLSKLIMNRAMDNMNIDNIKLVLKYFPVVYNETGSTGETFIECAVKKNSREIFALFLDNKADVNTVSKNGQSVLELAVANRSHKITQKLLDKKVNLKITPSSGGNLVNLAVQNENIVLLDMLIKSGYSINDADNAGHSPLQCAIKINNYKISEILMAKGANINISPDDGGNLLHFAIDKNSLPVFTLLLEKGLPVDQMDKNGNTVLNYTLTNDRIDFIDLILNANPNLEAVNNKNLKPIHYSVSKGLTDITNKLIEKGADVNARGEKGWTPLHYAVNNNNAQLVTLLLSKKANKEIADDSGKTPLKLAKEKDYTDIKKIIKRYK